MNIRKTEQKDLSVVMDIYDCARNIMRKNGNTDQWINGYPSVELISKEIENSHSFVCENEQGEIVGTFCFIEGDDPTYSNIYEGQWLNDEPYGVIHRMGSNGKQKGIASESLKWCFDHCKNIRIDTHRKNLIMQNLLLKNGFTQCGIIYIQDGTERLAFQKTINTNH
ncbi:MAG: GNAT family protein [Bacteroidota bacterium]|nr:GNAT family protein [Bacteroidota bacterium]